MAKTGTMVTYPFSSCKEITDWIETLPEGEKEVAKKYPPYTLLRVYGEPDRWIVGYRSSVVGVLIEVSRINPAEDYDGAVEGEREYLSGVAVLKVN